MAGRDGQRVVCQFVMLEVHYSSASLRRKKLGRFNSSRFKFLNTFMILRLLASEPSTNNFLHGLGMAEDSKAAITDLSNGDVASKYREAATASTGEITLLLFLHTRFRPLRRSQTRCSKRLSRASLLQGPRSLTSASLPMKA